MVSGSSSIKLLCRFSSSKFANSPILSGKIEILLWDKLSTLSVFQSAISGGTTVMRFSERITDSILVTFHNALGISFKDCLVSSTFGWFGTVTTGAAHLEIWESHLSRSSLELAWRWNLCPGTVNENRNIFSLSLLVSSLNPFVSCRLATPRHTFLFFSLLHYESILQQSFISNVRYFCTKWSYDMLRMEFPQ